MTHIWNDSLLCDAIRTGDRSRAIEEVRRAVADGEQPAAMLDVMAAAMDEVGDAYQRNQMFVPELLVAARAMKGAVAVLEPLLLEAGVEPEFTAVIGTVQGDLHDVGKGLVAMMWTAAGFEVIDLGTDVAPDTFAAAAAEHDADLVGVSALITTTMAVMRDSVEAVKGATEIPVVVGGAPVTAEFADEIGADGFAPDAGAAVVLARRLVGEAAIG